MIQAGREQRWIDHRGLQLPEPVLRVLNGHVCILTDRRGQVDLMNDPFRPLREEYLENARQRVSELDSLVASLPGDKTVTARLRQIAHNLRGSGGFYGFKAISAAAARLEELALAMLGGNPVPKERLARAVRDLAEAVANAQGEEPQ